MELLICISSLAPLSLLVGRPCGSHPFGGQSSGPHLLSDHISGRVLLQQEKEVSAGA